MDELHVFLYELFHVVDTEPGENRKPYQYSYDGEIEVLFVSLDRGKDLIVTEILS